MARWWSEIDTLSFILILIIIASGIVLIITASPPVAERIGLKPFYFVYKQIIYIILSISVLISISMLEEAWMKRLCIIGFGITLFLLVVVLIFGDEAKGAKRWITILGFSLQPSEVIKPFYGVVIAIMLSEISDISQNKKFLFCSMLHAFVILLLILQPDFGMVVTISLVTAGQFFVAGLSLSLLICSIILLIAMAFLAYHLLPHVHSRIESFLSDDAAANNYQIGKSLESYIQGGFLGKGPGEGTVKLVLPDAHTDFIFAVVGEEFGSISCIIIIALFAFFVLHGIIKLTMSNNLFHIYAATSVLMYFAIQSIFNIGVTLHLFPTKGMTLPFISYGGSSMLSFALAIGIYLNITKRHHKINRALTIRT